MFGKITFARLRGAKEPGRVQATFTDTFSALSTRRPYAYGYTYILTRRAESTRMNGKKRNRSSANTSGYRGVRKRGKRFQSRISVNGKECVIGRYETAKAAGLAFDRAVTQYKRPRSLLNFPNGLPSDDEDYDELMNPIKKCRLKSTNTSGYIGVTKGGNKKRFEAQLRIDGKKTSLGTYETAKEAALAYDRAVIQHKLPSSKLNFPNECATSREDDESRKEENGGSSSDDDNESDDEATLESSRSAQAQPIFERDPMLDQLVADEQNKTLLFDV